MKAALTAPNDDETLDTLSNRLKILQRRKGHRATSDDVLLAWAIVTAAQPHDRLLDLGTGKGTVAMLSLSVCPHLTAVGVEAFARERIPCTTKYHPECSRAVWTSSKATYAIPAMLAGRGPFKLVAGAPPFMPVGSGILPSDPQRAAGRFELRGASKPTTRPPQEISHQMPPSSS